MKEYIIFILCFGCHLISYSQNVSIQIEEKLIIGNDDSGQRETYFILPQYIRTDTDNNIYIADKNSSRIKVFKKNGEFITYIGKKGQGPGEILEISGISITKNNDLIVMDKLNKRFTRFFDVGNNFISYKFIDSKCIDPNHIICYTDTSFIIYYPAFQENVISGSHVFHQYTDDFANVVTSFGTINEIWRDDEEKAKNAFPSFPGHISISPNGDVLFLPFLYNGTFYRYKSSDRSFQLFSYTREKLLKSYKRLNDNRKLVEFKKMPGLLRTSSPAGKFTIQILCKSCGIYQKSNGDIFIFYYVVDKNNVYYYVDVFNVKNEYIASQRLFARIEGENTEKMFDKILWMDKDNNFYANGYLNDYSVVFKFSIFVNHDSM
ncbi:6-bladed beta-propeller [bacterium]|nr:6-bladed beta-propeller [bacterium]